jgi:hypothetical protein
VICRSDRVAAVSGGQPAALLAHGAVSLGNSLVNNLKHKELSPSAPTASYTFNNLKVNRNHDMFRSDHTIIQLTEINTKGYKWHLYCYPNMSASQYVIKRRYKSIV